MGKFIVFEGGEGSGKTLQIRALARTLKKSGKKILITHEPGGTSMANKIRDLILSNYSEKVYPRTELFLFLASRAQHIEEKVLPALKKDYWVLCDRFSGSTFAYQIGAQKLDNEKLIFKMDEYARHGLKTDLVIYLDVDPKLGIKRKKKQLTKLSKYDQQIITFHKAVRKYFKKLAKQNKNWITINANKTLEENKKQIHEIIDRKIR